MSVDIKKGTVLFSGFDDHIEYAMSYIKRNNLTNEMVRVRKLKKDGDYYVVVEAKINFELK